ncbi:MAG: hypothetical protein LBQ35_06540 [Spirochaetaceae bacterium]|jgi:hypothetical protein|nr:hypothetical protein [Spirochaetaceae bacterium]
MRLFRVIMAGLFAAGLAGGLAAQTAAPAGDAMPGVFRAGAVAAAGRIEDFRLMQTQDGAAYLFVIEDGRLRVFRGGGSGGFAEFSPDPALPPLNGGVRDLRLFDEPPLQYAAFIARGEDGEGIYVLGIDLEGALRYYPAPELRGFAGITEYRLAASVYSGAAVYVLAEGQLSCIANFCAGEDSEEAPVRQLISRSGERIDSPGGAFEVLREAAYPLGRGWITAAQEGGRELSFFALGEDLLLRREAAGFFEGEISVEAGIDGEGMSYFAVAHGEDFSLYRGDGGAFRREQNPSLAGWNGGEAAAQKPAEWLSTWLLLCAWGFEPARACYLIPQTGELAAGIHRGGNFEILRRQNLEEAAGLIPGGEAEYRKSPVVNRMLYLAALRGEQIELYRVTAPGTPLPGGTEAGAGGQS